MKKYRLLRFGHCYITKNGDFAVALIGGNKKRGYIFKAAHTCRLFILDKVQIRTRGVPNDGNWVEITPQDFAVAYQLINGGYAVKMEVPDEHGNLPTGPYNPRGVPKY
jgi:hypothetical protein